MNLNKHTKKVLFNHGVEVVVLPRQTVIYARKSVGNNENSDRSIEEQIENCTALCDRLGLPLHSEDIIREKIGLGGDHYWYGAGEATMIDVNGEYRAPRPGMTKLVKLLESGKVKVLVVWDDSRLWRSVGVCALLTDIIRRMKVVVMDRNGNVVDLNSPSGIQMVSIIAAGNQQHREMTIVNINRAFDAKLERGEPRSTRRVLGFKPIGKSKVEAVAEEVALVRRIFTMYVHGEGGSGPMSASAIAAQLRRENCALFPRHVSYAHLGPKFICTQTIYWVLRNVRYIAKQRKGKGADGSLYDNRAYLVDGNPVITQALWSATQRKLQSVRGIAPKHHNAAGLTGLLRCGVCGKFYGRFGRRSNGLGYECNARWSIRSAKTFHECNDLPPSLLVAEVDLFLRTQLLPMLLAEARERLTDGRLQEAANVLAELEHRRACRDRELEEAMRLAFKDLAKNSTLYASLHKDRENELSELDAEIAIRRMDFEALNEGNEQLTQIEATNTDGVRRLVKWAAVVPLHPAKERDRHKNLIRGKDQGRVLILTRWHTYHTAVIEWTNSAIPVNHMRQNVLRLAEPGERLVDVMDLPDPIRFVANMRRGVTSMGRVAFSLDDWAPGFRGTLSTPDLKDYPTSYFEVLEDSPAERQ